MSKNKQYSLLSNADSVLKEFQDTEKSREYLLYISWIDKFLLTIVLLEILLGGNGYLIQIAGVRSRILIYVVCMVWVALRMLIKPKIRLPNLVIGFSLAFLLVVSFATLNGFLKGNSLVAMGGELQGLMYFFMFLFFTVVIKDQKDINLISRLIVTCGVIQSFIYLFLLLIMYLGFVSYSDIYILLKNSNDVTVNEFIFRHNPHQPMYIGFFYKGFFHLGIATLFILFQSEKNRIGLALLTMTALALSMTRGLMLATILSALFGMFFMRDKRRIFASLAVLVFGVIIQYRALQHEQFLLSNFPRPKETTLRKRVNKPVTPQETTLLSEHVNKPVMPQETTLLSEHVSKPVTPQETTLLSEHVNKPVTPQETTLLSEHVNKPVTPQKTAFLSEHVSKPVTPQETTLLSEHVSKPVTPQETTLLSEHVSKPVTPQETTLLSEHVSKPVTPQETTLLSEHVSKPVTPQKTAFLSERKPVTPQEKTLLNSYTAFIRTTDNIRLTDLKEVLKEIDLSMIFIGRGIGTPIGTRQRVEMVFLEIFYKQGFLGLFFWLSLLGTSFFLFWKLKPERKSEALPFLLAPIFVYSTSAMNNFLTGSIGMSIVLICIAVLVVISTTTTKSKYSFSKNESNFENE